MNFVSYIITHDFIPLTLIVFFIGIFGLSSSRKNMIVVLVSIEIILISSNINFVVFSFVNDDLVGQIFALMILTIAAAESAIGLALVVLHYRHRSIISIDSISFLKG